MWYIDNPFFLSFFLSRGKHFVSDQNSTQVCEKDGKASCWLHKRFPIKPENTFNSAMLIKLPIHRIHKWRPINYSFVSNLLYFVRAN